jgi:hypothetical protein
LLLEKQIIEIEKKVKFIWTNCSKHFLMYFIFIF